MIQRRSPCESAATCLIPRAAAASSHVLSISEPSDPSASGNSGSNPPATPPPAEVAPGAAPAATAPGAKKPKKKPSVSKGTGTLQASPSTHWLPFLLVRTGPSLGVRRGRPAPGTRLLYTNASRPLGSRAGSQDEAQAAHLGGGRRLRAGPTGPGPEALPGPAARDAAHPPAGQADQEGDGSRVRSSCRREERRQSQPRSVSRAMLSP